MTNNELTYIFTYNITPIPKLRARTTQHHTFTPKKTRDFETSIKYATYMAMSDWNIETYPKEVPLHISIDLFILAPKRLIRKGKLIEGCFPVVKPDLDNYVKSILDGLNGVLYTDDSQITELEATKNYTDSNPQIVVKVSTNLK